MNHPGPGRRQMLAALAAVGVGAVVGTVGERAHRPYRAPKALPSAVSDKARAGWRPNILLIMSDQERGWPDLPPGLGLDAHEWLLAHGTGFTRHHVHTTPCSPSRSTLYFGQHTQHTHMTANLDAPPTFPQLSSGMPSMGHLLRAQGYYTAYKGKWHLSPVAHDPGLVYGAYPNTVDALEPYGFSDYNIDGDPHGATWTGYRYDAQIASQAVQWLGTRGRALADERKPWFLAVNFVNPHDIMYFSSGDAQQRSRLRRDLLAPLSAPPTGGAYDRRWDMPLPVSHYRDDLSTKPWAQRSYVEVCDMLYGRIDPADETSWRAYQSYYFNCVRDVDGHALTVLRALERLGMDRDTIVVYTADHGEMAGAHRLRQKGPHMYKENIRVPLIVRHPDVRSGVQTDALSGAVDLLPTLLGFAGVEDAARKERYPWLRGVDLGTAVADARARTERDARGILFNYGVPLYIDPDFMRDTIETDARSPGIAALRVALGKGQMFPGREHPALFRGVHDGRYKFARYFRPADHHTPTDWETLTARNELELYDTQADPDELVNLAAHPDAHKDLILALSARTNALVALEVGSDTGAEFPGPAHWYERG
ncbi:sulfatase-like hydrolase/transferase [Variovorax ureilyticus]|uniref:sulfatase-like hydrolase/transferase n=1 Tax=Variovorax ureilyticus TaxID=1836198 RepID=UPI003D6643E7